MSPAMLVRIQERRRVLLMTAIAAVFTVAAASSGSPADDSVGPTDSDRAAVRGARKDHHAQPAATPRGMALRPKQELRAHGSDQHHGESRGDSQTRYPGDLQNHGGPVVESVQSHAIYLQPHGVCPISTCWGDPERFLRDLGHSDLIHVVDQYVGLQGDNRYTVGQRALINYTPSTTPLTDDDVLGYVHAVAASTGKTGYDHIYHVFLPPGQDECFDSSFSTCYSPDNFDTFYFCAYHGYVDFPDIGHVLYSVEPSQAVPGCRDTQTPDGPLPNGILVDSTNDTLSHELIEAITDPDLDAWWNSVGLGMYGQEIADECIFLDGPATFRVRHRNYAAQTEYSNREHACVVAP